MKINRTLTTLFTFVFIILIWYFASLKTNQLFIPSPIKVFDDAMQLLASKKLLVDTFWTFKRIFIASVISGIVSLPLGLLIYNFTIFKDTIYPVVSLMRYVPVAAFYPLLIMGIGDLAYDSAPIQASQFESDIRIAEQLDKIYFEAGGGGNNYESYTAAWYFGLNHCKLDCWKRGKKGIIITMGDEPLNPYLPTKGRYSGLSAATGDNLQADVETGELYEEVIKKYDVYHLAVDDFVTSYRMYEDRIKSSFGRYLDENHLKVVNLDSIAGTIVNIVCGSDEDIESKPEGSNESGMISW